jgi:hypothetical protein
MRTCFFSDSDKLASGDGRFRHSTCVAYFITFWHHHRIDIRRLANRPFKNGTLKVPYLSLMEKSQQRVIIYYFSLKGWGARTIRKETAEALGADAYSQVQALRRPTQFGTGDISCLDELRTG